MMTDKEEFIAQIARMTLDGEDIDGVEFEQSIDDAYDTLAVIVRRARELMP